MAQHDYVIANASGATVRADINSMALAISSNNSGSSAPSTTYAYEFWVDTGNSLLKLRNAANNAWITMPLSVTASNTVDINGGTIDGTNVGASSAGTAAFTTLAASGATDLNSTLAVSGTVSLDGSANELRFYEGSNYVGFEAPALTGDQIWVLPTADGSASQVLTTNGSGTLSWASAGGAWTEGSGNVYRSSGNAGLGTTTPNEAGFGAGSRVLSIQGAAADDFGVLELISPDVTSSNRIGEVRFGNLDGGSAFTANAGMRATRDGADDAVALSFWTEATGGAFTERLTIKSGGAVGVGTASPNAALDIVSDSSANGIELRGRSADNIGQLTFESNDSGTTYSQLQSLSTELKVKAVANIPISFHTNNSERVRIDANGDVGIDNTSPSAKLHVTQTATDEPCGYFYQNTSGAQNCLQVINDGAGNSGAALYVRNDGTGNAITVDDGAGGTTKFVINQYGQAYFDATSAAYSDARITSHGGDVVCVGDNNSAFMSDLLPGYTRGDYGVFGSTANNIYFKIGSSYVAYVGSSGAWNVSDVSLKKNIADLSGSLAKVLQLKGRTFKWKDASRGTDTNIGFVAQEVETVVPELVSDGGLGKDNSGNDAPKVVNYANMSALLVEALKELEARVKTLEG